MKEVSSKYSNLDKYSAYSEDSEYHRQPMHIMKGIMGEEAAANYLKSRGLSIIDRNFRARHCEIDIIAKDGDEIVIVEVRTRTKGWLMKPEESVGAIKLSRLIHAGKIWIMEHNYQGVWRVDIISITLKDGKIINIEHIKDVTEPII